MLVRGAEMDFGENLGAKLFMALVSKYTKIFNFPRQNERREMGVGGEGPFLCHVDVLCKICSNCLCG